MPRLRTVNPDLPPRMQMKGSTYYYTPFINGKVVWTRIGKTYGDAITKYAELERGDYQVGTTYAALAAEYIRRILPELKERTRKVYAYEIARTIKVFGAMPLDEVQPHHIARAMDAMLDTPTAANRLRARMDTIFSYGVRWGWCKSNPARDIKNVKEGGVRDRYLTDDEVVRIYAVANRTLRIAMELGYMIGVRVSDLLALKWSDLTEAGITVMQTKNQVRGNYTRSAELEDFLQRAKKGGNIKSMFLISRRDGQPYTYRGFYSFWERAVEKAKVEDAHFHDLRAKAITDATAEGRKAQSFSLHRNERQAEDYVKVRQTPEVMPLSWRDLEKRWDLEKSKPSKKSA